MATRIHCLGLVLTVASLACSSSQSGTSSGSTTASSTTGTGSTTTGGSTGGTTTGSTTSGTTTGTTGDAGCTCDAGYCDPNGTGNCLQCLNDTQCTPPTGVCQTSPAELHYGECVECTTAEPTCPAGKVCDLSIGST